MDNRWKICTIEDLGEIARGRSKHRPRNDEILFGGKYPFIQTADVKSANLYIDEFSSTYNDVGLAQSKLWGKGTLCITIAANIAETGILGLDACFPDSIVGFIPYSHVSDVRFVKYMIDMFKMYMQQISRGTTQDNLSLSKISKVKFAIPDYEIQCKIADRLSSYDNLILINNKRIKILEQMAENLYKEWFVRFRFPGHEKAEFVDGVPKGWEYCKLKKIINISRGLSYTSEEIDCIDGVDLINLKNIQAFGGFNESGTKKYSGKYKTGQVVRENDLIMGVTDMTQDRRVVGSVALIPPINNVSVISADLIKILPNNISNIFLYSMFKYGSVSKFVSQFANGANVLHLRPQVLDKIKVLLPEGSLIEKYLNIITGFISEKNNLQQQNQNLIKQRDYLLPRLMSGKLQVK